MVLRHPALVSVGAFLVAAGTGVVISPVVGVVILLLGGALIAYGVQSMSEWLPHVQIERGPGLAVRFLPAERAGRRRLVNETKELIANIRADESSTRSLATPGELATYNADLKATTQEEADQRRLRRDVAKDRGWRLELVDRLRPLADQYQRRGLLSHREYEELLAPPPEPTIGDGSAITIYPSGHMPVADRLEALANKL